MTTTDFPAKAPVIVERKLGNGLRIIFIPDHRAPVVTHMVWYCNGAADDPVGKSGIAHFLEHLMFKGTHKHPQGEFSKIVADLGGQENAFTGHDYTAYFQRIAKEHLGVMMEFEADRMTGLTLSDEVVTPERDVVLEERRMHYDAHPSAQLQEAVQATLFTNHPYGRPVIGWGHEIAALNREDAFAYYHRFYTPENAILVVAGDIEEDAVLALAERHYGVIPARGAPPQRQRAREPKPVAARDVRLSDAKVELPQWQRSYLCPSHVTGAEGQAEALELLAHLLGGGSTSHLYRTLVIGERIAVSAGAGYLGSAMDDTRFVVYGTPAESTRLADLEAAVEREVGAFLDAGIAAEDLERGKNRLIADTIYAQDSQVALARWYGSWLAGGRTIADVQSWPERIEKVTASEIVAAGRQWLDRSRAVTGYLTPLGVA